MSRGRTLVLIVACLLAGAAVVAFGGDRPEMEAPRVDLDCTRFAATTGADSAPGTRARPFRTPQRLVDSLRAGETGCLRDGVYEAAEGEDFLVQFTRAGRAGAPITLGSAPGERARLVGIVVVDEGADHTRLAGVDVEGTGDQNTIKVYAADTTIESNEITNELRGESCVILGSSDGGRAVRPVIRDNVFHDCGSPANDNHDHGIYAAIVEDARIVDNVFTNSAATSIQIYPDAQDSYVARNVMDGGPDSVRGGIVIGGDADTTSNGNVIERNVIAHTETHSVYSFWAGDVGEGNVVRDNCLWDAGSEPPVLDEGGLEVGDNPVADPEFADRDGRDYALTDDSPCRDAIGAPAE